MSHFSKIKTQFKNRETLIETLKGAGYQVTEGPNLKLDMKYRIDGIKNEKVDFIINHEDLSQQNFMGGITNSDGTLEIAGDAYCVNKGGRRFDMNEFVGSIKAEYAEKEIIRQFSTTPDLSEFDLTNREISARTGEVVLTFQRWN
jgi:hypothetical protein